MRVFQVTADGSVDCANEPADQEAKVAPLHYWEVITGLTLLAPGGCLVVKMFTMFDGTSVSLMYLLCCLFEQVHF
jgi:cap2 methyltransferase